MEVPRQLRLIRRNWLLILACTVPAVLAAAAATAATAPRYSASITMFVSVADRSMSASTAYQASLLSQERVKSYANLLTSDRVAGQVARAIGGPLTLDQVKAETTAEAVPDTVLLRATVTDASPGRAKQIADMLGVRFVALIDQLERPVAGQPAFVKVTVVDGARMPVVPVSPHLPTNLLLGLLAGLTLGTAASLLRESLDMSVRTLDQLSEITGSPALGLICQDDSVSRRPLIVQGPAHAARAEAFRFLRTNLQFVDAADPIRSVVITGVLPGQGASLTACNLALALAQAGRRVILLDAALRKPGVARYLGMTETTGLTSVVAGQATLEQALRPWDDLPLSVITSGPLPPNPSELLGTPSMQSILAELRDRADILIIDAPPLLSFADAAVLARGCDGAVLVARHGRTSKDQLHRAAEQLRSVDARLLGTVLNRAPAGNESGYGYSYAYDYDIADAGLSAGGGRA